MHRLLRFEFVRLIRSGVAAMTIALILAICILGMVLDYVCYSNNSPMASMISIYNAYTQFTYLILGFVFIQTFTKDYERGVNNFYIQQGYNMIDFYVSKFILLVLLTLPVIDTLLIAANILYNNSNVMFLAEMIIIVDLSIVYIILLSMAISILTRKVVQAVLIFYGFFILFNIGNLFLLGLFNPADVNSFSAYLLNLMANQNVTHYSLDGINLGSIQHKTIISVVIPLLDSIIILLVDVLLLNNKSIDSQTKKYRVNVVKLLR